MRLIVDILRQAELIVYQTMSETAPQRIQCAVNNLLREVLQLSRNLPQVPALCKDLFENQRLQENDIEQITALIVLKPDTPTGCRYLVLSLDGLFWCQSYPYTAPSILWWSERIRAEPSAWVNYVGEILAACQQYVSFLEEHAA